MTKEVVDYFMDVTGEKFKGVAKRFDSVEKRFDKIDATLEDLKEYKWVSTGKLITFNIIISAAFALIAAWISR